MKIATLLCILMLAAAASAEKVHMTLYAPDEDCGEKFAAYVDLKVRNGTCFSLSEFNYRLSCDALAEDSAWEFEVFGPSECRPDLHSTQVYEGTGNTDCVYLPFTDSSIRVDCSAAVSPGPGVYIVGAIIASLAVFLSL